MPQPANLDRWRYRAPQRRCEGVRRSQAAWACALALMVAGCAGGPFAALSPPNDPLTTGSITPRAAQAPTLGLEAEDWARASEALATALDPRGAGVSVPWANPATRYSGTIAPVGKPSVSGDLVCRAFTATTRSADGDETRHDGRACRLSAEVWRVEEAERVEAEGAI